MSQTSINNKYTNEVHRLLRQGSGSVATASYSHMSKKTKLSHGGTNSFPETTLSAMVPDENLSNYDSSVLDLNSKPGTVYAERESTNNPKNEKATIAVVAVHNVFPKMKFLHRDHQLDFSTESNSLCQYVIKKCNVSAMTNQREWWERNRKFVIKKITAERSNKSSSLRWAFYGKL